MLTAQSPSYEYQVGGSLPLDAPSYVRRQADEQLYQALLNSEFCYVLNSRQMGKSSLRVQTMYRLQTVGIRCGTIDITAIGTQQVTPEQWYASIVGSLASSFQLQVNVRTWWRDHNHLSNVNRLSAFLETVLLVELEPNVVIFIDEIDSVLGLKFSVDDFFALIRVCHNKRAETSSYKRLTFALLGVATPADLITDKNRTPFNIGQAIDLKGFERSEAMPLLPGLTGIVSEPKAVLKQILHWTQGQPFLTQKLCKLVLGATQERGETVLRFPFEGEALWVEQLVRSHIIENWEAKDEPEHLKTIRDRLLRNTQRSGRLLGIYQQILQGVEVQTDDSREQVELLLSGLIVKQQSILQVRNPIYQEVFNLEWVEKQLSSLRPYSQSFEAWIASQQTDSSRLLRGQALKDGQIWAQGKSLSNLDYQFLAASAELDRREVQQALEAERTKEVEARLTEQNKRLIQEKQAAKRQRRLLFAVSIALLLACGLGVTSYFQYRQAAISERHARISEIEALVSSSEGLFASNRRLDALIEAIKAKRRLQNLGNTGKKIENQVINVLQQAVYEGDEYNRLSGHKSAVITVDISPDSQLIASGSVDKTIKLWRRDGTEVATLKGHQAIVRSVKFSPDGQLIASGSDGGTVKLWRKDGTLLKTFQGHSAGIWVVAFSPDGQTIASGSVDTTVKLWHKDGSLLKTFQGHTAAVSSVAFSPDGQTIASTSADKTVKLWSKNGILLRTFQGHAAVASSVAFSPDGQTIASASGDKTVKLWNKNGTLLGTLQGHTAVISAVVFSPDGQTIASASRDKTVKLWNIDGTELTTFRGHSAGIWGIAWSPDGSFIASAGGENSVRLWQSKNPLRTIVTGHKAGIWALDVSADSSRIATGSEDGATKLWSRQGKLLATVSEQDAGIYAIALSHDHRLIAFGKNDNIVNVWDWKGAAISANALVRNAIATFAGHSATVTGLAWSPDGQTIASASQDNTIKLWRPGDTCTGETSAAKSLGNTNGCSPRKTLIGHHAGIWQVVFSADGQLIASAGGDGTVKLWKLDGTLVRTFRGHTAAVFRVAFSPDGKMVASGSGDNTIKLWTIDGKLLRTLEGHHAAVWGVAFSPDGQIIASGGSDNTVKFWKLDGTELTTLRGHSGGIRGVAYSSDGTFVASVSEDNTLILWNVQQILNLDLWGYGCHRVRDYLRTNADVKEEDRNLCDGIKSQNTPQ